MKGQAISYQIVNYLYGYYKYETKTNYVLNFNTLRSINNELMI